jgi:hypothetical protein
MTQSIGDISARLMAEQATGLAQPTKGLGKYYINESLHVSPRSAYDMLREGRAVQIHLPNAGAGSYREFFKSLGLETLVVVNQCSSAGDWVFAVQDGDFWYPAFQTNRYPRHGFSYSINFDEPFDTFERLCESNT